MPRAQARPPAEVIDSINRKAATVRDAAAALSTRIERFQEYLAKLPGRVETDYHGPHPDADTPDDHGLMSLVLRLHRQGKSWILSCGTYDQRHEGNDPYYSIDFKPLTEVGLKYKMAAVKQFPNLLAAIEKSQEKLIKELEDATADFDTFEMTLTPTQKEGR